MKSYYPDKEQRLEIYKEILRRAEHNTEFSYGFCNALSKVTNEDQEFTDEIDYYPELTEYEPEKHWNEDEDYWFKEGDLTPRIEILKKVIAKMESL